MRVRLYRRRTRSRWANWSSQREARWATAARDWRLEHMDPKLRTVVKLQVFEGGTADEAAEILHCAPRTVHKYWSFARLWLATELGKTADEAH